MANTKTALQHPTELALADFLAGTLSPTERRAIEEHLAGCAECCAHITAAHESLRAFRHTGTPHKELPMKKVNMYLILAVVSFALSFIMPRYFLQFLIATLLLGIKWIVDAKSTKMLVMIYEAWQKGGEKEASRIIETLDAGKKSRF